MIPSTSLHVYIKVHTINLFVVIIAVTIISNFLLTLCYDELVYESFYIPLYVCIMKLKFRLPYVVHNCNVNRA